MAGSQFLTEDQENQLLGYPRISPVEQQARRQELTAFGLEGICQAGEQSLCDLQILGLGYVGLVVLVIREGKQFALKIRRTNAKRESLLPEAKAIRQANKVGVAPKIYQASDNFILMDFIEGKSFLEWLQWAIAKYPTSIILDVINNLLEQAYKLDQIGLDRDDMKCITKDVIVTATHQPVLLDFSNASGDRRPQNVTALVQGLFWGSVIAKYLKPLLPHCNQEQLLSHLRHYKGHPNRTNFDTLKQAITLSSLNL
ncbi:Ser/Thr protein kinase [[Leptolyngbya] sp. PCC 7376]|uniref:Ser/Thr protein kinase n=1 Tax=[Leptolyngbya] sp. PCC 7376 TaxID=111781 RepID=UPI00029EF9D5|nr:Ser/Thr protein kinase [[Leptolyngbya] sp. PCC 7376]AFY38906.1 Ser/Thr protein kinase [[Leptolyngbya] sp. PCC 7376]